MAFISGPRQVGKTTLGKSLLKSKNNYFSWNNPHFQRTWMHSPEGAIKKIGHGPVLFDEMHKNRKWNPHLKDLYDSYKDNLGIIVTGSNRLDTYRKHSDSLLGRYIPYRLTLFSVTENFKSPSPDQVLHKTRFLITGKV